MAYSRYYASEDTPINSGVLTHTLANPDNNNFGYLNPYHLEVYASKSDQSMSAFQADVASGYADQYVLNNDFTLANNVITISNLATNKRYRLFIKRVTPKLRHFVDFQAGSPLTEADLDNSNKYSLFREQEIEDDLADAKADILAIPDQLSDDVSRLRTSFTTTISGGDSVYDITHNLGYHPVVQVFEGNSLPSNQLDCVVTHVSTSVTRLTFEGSAVTATAEFR